MQVVIGSDHAGIELKADLVDMLAARQVEVHDCGTFSSQAVDYPTLLSW